MGRSKFPGKPSKHIFKKRVNVLPSAGESSDQEGSATGSGAGSGSSSSGVSPSASFNEEDNNGKSNNEEGCSDNEDRSVLNTDLRSKSCVKIIENCKVKKRRKTKKNMIGDLRASGFKTKLKNIQKSRKRIPKKADTIGRQFTRSAFESKSIVGKFVLPSRSIHSSRVIKPNKRFINVDLNENTGLKRKVLAKTICVKASKVITMKRITEKTSKFNNKSFCNAISDRISKKHVILRQARLKIHSQTIAKSIGPFSSNSNETSQSGTVTCGVCGAVRFYRFMEQACKFNIYSCESCRKFISKMIKRLACKSSASTLVCLKGFGMCHVPPIMRSQQCKLIRSAYRSRCPACWLKMCLRSFQMPLSLKTSLIELLPENMQSSFATSSGDSVTNLSSEFAQTSMPNSKIKPPKVENRSCTIKSQNPISNDNNLITSASVEMIKRQKVDVKGPRVKHVCRSASIVLGQTLATFPFDNNKKQQTSNVKEIDVSVPLQRKKGLGSNKFKNGTDNSDNRTDKKPIGCNQPNVPCIQQKKRQKGPILSPNYDTRSKANQNPSTITGRNSILLRRPVPCFLSGRTLLSAESFPMRAVCLFCGSAGKEDLLHCLLCCEPYHPFCLKLGPAITVEPWLCPRCTTCKACNIDDDNAKLECQKCSKFYHEKCVAVNRRRDGLFVCSQCLLCKECGSSNIKNYILNVPLCYSCFKLKIDDKKCPLCQDIYYMNNIFENDSEILECCVCNKWLHLECCNIRIEQRAILGVLPDSMGYICKACSKDNVPYWRAAVYFKLSNIFNNILQELIENKSTRNLMKVNPLSLNENSDKYLSVMKRIQPVTEGDIESDKKKEDINSCDIDLPFGVIRSKIYSNLYKSVAEFNSEMEEILSFSGSEKLLNLYRSILLKVFPFFPNSSISSIDSISEKLLTNLTMKSSNVTYSDLAVQEDTRVCVLCKQKGDGVSNKQSRLLYCRENEWVHANCLIWSSEVYETIDGRLKNVSFSISRGKTTSCTLCKENGATLNCSFKLCSKIFHFHCAETTECQFLMNKSIYCSSHLLSSSPQLCKDFAVSRPVFIEKPESKNVPQFEKIHIMIGSLQINSLGKINSVLSDNVKNIIPIGYSCTRMFWSTIEPWKITSYTVTTSAINYPVGENTASDTNFTIDHSLSLSSVNQKVKEMNNWFKEIDKSHLNDTEDDEIEEENQQGADLLSPEITDAILKEIPCDLLNGISLQDIFPKFATGDDLNIDDVKSKIESTDKNRCSVTLSCKLNRSISPVLKKRKLNVPSNNIFLQVLQLDGTFDDDDNLQQPIRESRSIPQLDGNVDSDCDQESQTKTKMPEEPVTCSRCHCTYRTRLSFKRHLESCEQITSESDSEIMEHDNIIVSATPPNNDHFRHENVYTLAQSNFSRESYIINNISDRRNTVVYPVELTNLPVNTKTITYVPQLDNSHDKQEYAAMINEPAPAAPCIFDSADYPVEITNLPANTKTIRYIPQLDTSHIEQEYAATVINESTPAIVEPAEHTSITISGSRSSSNSSSNCTKQDYEGDDEFFIIEDSKYKPTTSSEPAAPSYVIQEPEKQTTSPRCNTCSSTKSQYDDYLQPINIHIHPSAESVNTPSSYLNYPASGVILDENQMDFQGISLTNQSLQYVNRNPYLNIEPHQQIIINGGKLLTNVNSYVKPAVDQYGQLMNIVTTDNINKSNIMLQSTESVAIRNQNNKPEYTIQQQETPAAIVIPNYLSLGGGASAGAGAGASHNYQQQNDYKTMQPLTIQAEVMPVPMPVPQIQTMPQTVVIQQQPQQYIIDNNVPITFTQPPVYYGFETIIQNTVMASQQIMPTAVPGVITANSSYQTTTQVFQTSKMESVPVLDIPTNTYVVVSSGQILGSVPLQLTYTQPTQLQLGTITTEAPRPLKITQTECVSNAKPKMIKKVINLPSSPLVVKKEQNIPTNVVPPQPKIIVNKQTRPMNRVLPMKKVINIKKIDESDKVIKERDKPLPARPPPPVSSKENKRIIIRDVRRLDIDKSKRFDDDLLKPLSDKALTKSVKKTISRDMPLLGRHEVQSYSSLAAQKINCIDKIDPRRVSAQKQTIHIGNNNSRIETTCTTTPPVKASAKNCGVRFSSCLNSNRLPNIISSTPLSAPAKIPTPILAPSGKRYKLDKSPGVISTTHAAQLLVQSSPTASPLSSLASIVSNVPTTIMSKMERPKTETSPSTLIPNTNVPVLAPIKRSYPEESSVASPYISTYSNIKSSVKTVTSLYEASNGTSCWKIDNKFRNNKNTTTCTITSASTDTGKRSASASAITNTSTSTSTSASTSAGNYNNSSCTLPVTAISKSTNTSTITSTITNTPSTISNANGTNITPAQNVMYAKKSVVKVPTMLYTIETPDGYRHTSTSVAELWSKVFSVVQNARALHNLPPLPVLNKNPLDGVSLMGLNSDEVKYLLEQLPGAGQCTKYEPAFILPFSSHSEDDEVSIGHLFGSARFIPHANKKNDCSHDMFGWLASKHRVLESTLSKTETLPRRNSISNLPLSKRFRQLKQSTKYSVGVYRSKIHRRGLFCLKGFDSGEMVIEYSGEVIRSILCDKREKYYNSKGIGCYMFRVDDNLVVDATMKGNSARFINHSCDPNCYSKVVELQGHKHIIIFALRKINYGEELTYDYKFPFEEDKIPCTCGSKKCRKFLN